MIDPILPPREGQLCSMVIYNNTPFCQHLRRELMSHDICPFGFYDASEAIHWWKENHQSIPISSLFIHQDIGESGIDLNTFLTELRENDEGRYIRTVVLGGGIVTWEKPKLLSSVGADIAYDPLRGHLLPPWALKEISKGFMSPEDLARRGEGFVRTHDPEFDRSDAWRKR